MFHFNFGLFFSKKKKKIFYAQMMMMMMLTNTKMGIVIFANECCPDRKKNFVIVSMKTKNDNLF